MRAALLLAIAVAAPVRADIDPGNWQITTSTALPGMSQPLELSQTRCLTEADAKDPSRLFGNTAGGGCQYTRRNDTGSVFTFELTCTAPAEARGTGAIRYSRDSLDGDLELTSAQFTARSRITARRLGGC